MTSRELQAIDQARRRASSILSLLDLGFTPADAVQAIKGPALSPRARQAAAVLAQRIRHDLEGLSFVLTGQVADAVLECFEIGEAPPDEIALALLFEPASPDATTPVSDADYRRGAGIEPKLAPGAKPEIDDHG